MTLERPPQDIIRLTTVLAEHERFDPLTDSDRPSIEVWVVEADGELYRWLLVAVLERTCVVANPRDHRQRVLRAHQHVWIRPGALELWAPHPVRGYSGRFNYDHGEMGRQHSLAARKAAAQ